MPNVERILIIDDQEVHRRKMSMAVSALGYEAVSADSGAEGLLKLKQGLYDLVLLDILMPIMDGFEVMNYMREEPRLKDIPVIVISALDGEMDTVVRAIKSGAQDFLPKNFDAVLLEARLTSSLERKRHRDRELEQLRRVERLTDAAAFLETELVDPKRLQIADIEQRSDAIGQLARVFTSMATQVYERERRLRQQIRTLRSTGMLVVLGVVSGLGVVLFRIASELSPNPFGIALWVNIICTGICLASAAFRGRLPKFDRTLFLIIVLWGFLAVVVAEVVILWVAQQLPASTIALILVSEGFIVFGIASVIRIEEANLRRLLGFFVGLAGVSLAIYSSQQSASVYIPVIWALFALLAPLAYALRTLLVTLRLRDDVDAFAATGFAALAGSIMLIPLVLYFDQFFMLGFDFDETNDGTLTLAIMLLGIVIGVGTSLKSVLIRSAGAVFASQSSYVVTFAGIGWSILLLGERLPATAWFALLLLFIGLLLVGPKRDAEEVDPIAMRRSGQPVDLEL